jgi:hypothetical integral membrane protein (TIGR02206 family)
VGLLQADRTFETYGPSHWVMIILLVAGSLVLVRTGRRYPQETVRRHARWFAVALVAFAIPLLIIRLVPPNWNLFTSLPLHLCDLAWMAAAYALWTQRPWAYAVTYYWGLTLTPQAIATPALDAGFPHLDFVAYWGQHLLIIWAAVYLTWVVGLRPDWRGYWRAIAITAGWMVSMLVFNAWAGTNYGYFSRKPDGPSLLDLMGGWPWYIGAEIVACAIVWALLTWPWTRSAPVEEHGRRGYAGTG